MNRWTNTAVVFSLLLLAGFEARGQESTVHEFIPELDLYYRLDARYRLFLLFQGTASDADSFNDSQIGFHIETGLAPIVRASLRKTYDVDRLRHLRLRAGIRYLTNLFSGGPKRREYRGILEVTPRVLLPLEILLVNRNRAEFRWIDGKYSTRLRFRLKVEREMEVFTGFLVSPHFLAEVFYDFRFDDWTRVRYQIGVLTRITSAVVLSLAYFRENNWYGPVDHHNAIRLGLVLFF